MMRTTKVSNINITTPAPRKVNVRATDAGRFSVPRSIAMTYTSVLENRCADDPRRRGRMTAAAALVVLVVLVAQQPC